jgi:hypothetical protein
MTEALQKVGVTALARPAFIAAGDQRGTEAIDKSDLQIPRLTLAQALSPEIQEGNAKQIEGLKFGDAFNNLTREIYGRVPLEIVVVRADPARYIEFFPRDAGGGIKDYDVPANDPRTKFSTDKDGKSVKPSATKFLEFVALLGDTHQPIALSFKGAGLKIARQLNGLIKIRQLPSFASVFQLTPTTETNTKGTFAAFVVKLLRNVDEDTYRLAERAFESFKDKTLVTQRDEDEDGAGTGDPSGDKVPF